MARKYKFQLKYHFHRENLPISLNESSMYFCSLFCPVLIIIYSFMFVCLFNGDLPS